jgi:hypothetical protein
MKLSENFKSRIKSLAGIVLSENKVIVNETNTSEPEGAHYKQSLLSIIENAKKIHQSIKDNDDLDPWIQDKITLSKHNMEAILDYFSETNKV